MMMPYLERFSLIMSNNKMDLSVEHCSWLCACILLKASKPVDITSFAQSDVTEATRLLYDRLTNQVHKCDMNN